MAGISRVDLTVELRWIEKGGRVAVRVRNESGGDLLKTPGGDGLELDEREGFVPRSFRRHDGTTCTLDDVLSAFVQQDHPMIEGLLTEPDQRRLGDFLTEGLFGSEKEQHALFARAFGVPEKNCPTCLDGRVRLLLRAAPDAYELLLLPWRAMSLAGQPLRRHDWIFALSTGKGPEDEATLGRPCRILLLIPDRGLSTTGGELPATDGVSHASSLHEMLCAIDEGFRAEGEIARVKNAVDVTRRLWEMKPSVVYWYGHASLAAGVLRLLFDDGPLSVKQLADDIANLKEGCPTLVFLNGCATGAGGLLSGPLQIGPIVPALVVNHALARMDTAAPMALAFFGALFRDGLEPAAALERAAGADGIDRDDWRWLAPATWASHRGWESIVTPRLTEAELDRFFLRLDRHTQRGRVFTLLGERVNELRERRPASTRALSFIYGGASGDMVQHFGPELFRYLRRGLIEHAQLIPIPRLALPDDPGVNARHAIRKALAAAVGADPAPIADKLRGMVHDVPEGKVPVLWLDWGTYPDPEGQVRDVSEEEVVRWQAALKDELPAHLPPDATAVSLLGLEVAAPAKATQRLRKELRDRKLLTGQIHIEVLQPLAAVEYEELIDLFRENEAQLGLGIDERHDVAEIILAETRGRYDETVKLLCKAKNEGWNSFRLELEQRPRKRRSARR